MARILRVNCAGLWYHITARGNEGKAIYRDDRDRAHFVELFAPWCERFRLKLHAYVLLENHYHLLLETTEANLSRAMQWLNVSYTLWFNRRHQRVGHLLQGRFKAVVVEPETWALRLSRYMHLNPVRLRRLGLDKAGQRARRQGIGKESGPAVLEGRRKRLREYRWSSYRAYAGYERAPAWLDSVSVLECGGGPPKQRQRRYRQDCQRELKEQDSEQPWDQIVGRLALGSEEFLEQLLERPKGKQPRRELQAALARRPDFSEIVAAIETFRGQSWAEFKEQRGDWGRDLALYLGRELGGMTLAELAQAVGTGSRMTVSIAIRRLRQRLERQKSLRQSLAKIAAQLQSRSSSRRSV